MSVLPEKTSRPAGRVAGVCVIVVGVVSMIVTWGPFLALTASGRAWGWMFLALGLWTLLMGFPMLRGRWRGKLLLVRGVSAMLMTVAFFAAFGLSLFILSAFFLTDPPGSLAHLILPASAGFVTALLIRSMFSLTDSPPPYARPRISARWMRRVRWLVPLMGVGGVAAFVYGISGEIWDVDEGKPGMMAAGLILMAMAVVYAAWCRTAEPVDEAEEEK
jgi:MFS family permease